RETVCIRKEAVAKWLANIDPAKCRVAKTRENLERFQRELFDAADRFLFGDDSTTVYDEATKTDKPVTGVLRGSDNCPHCGEAVCVTLDASGFHLTAKPDDDNDE